MKKDFFMYHEYFTKIVKGEIDINIASLKQTLKQYIDEYSLHEFGDCPFFILNNLPSTTKVDKGSYVKLNLDNTSFELSYLKVIINDNCFDHIENGVEYSIVKFKDDNELVEIINDIGEVETVLVSRCNFIEASLHKVKIVCTFSIKRGIADPIISFIIQDIMSDANITYDLPYNKIITNPLNNEKYLLLEHFMVQHTYFLKHVLKHIKEKYNWHFKIEQDKINCYENQNNMELSKEFTMNMEAYCYKEGKVI